MIRLHTAGLAALLMALLAFPSIAQGQNPNVSWTLLTPTVSASPGGTAEVRIEARLKPGNHLYSLKTYPGGDGPQPTEITVGNAPAVRLAGTPRASKRPIVKYDENFEINTEYWEGTVVFRIPITIARSAGEGTTVKAWVQPYFMTCDENSCMPPDSVPMNFIVEVIKDTAQAADSVAAAQAAMAADSIAAADSARAVADATRVDTGAAAVAKPNPNLDSPMGTTEDIARAKEEGLMAYLGLAAGMGALALLTPCVFPMIPITISFFTKRTQTTRKRSLRDAGLYSIGIILTFTAIGFLFALLLGASGINDFATNPWVNIAIAVVFVALALNLFGMFEIQVPTSVLNRLNRKAQSDGDSITGVLLMGLVFSLTSFTCTVPFVGALMVSATGGDWIWPLMGMAVFATVFAAPFFLLALFPAVMKSLPRSGGWLNAVKVVMGFIELAAAIKFFSNADLVWSWGVLTREVFLAIWIAIAVLTTMYLLGRFQLTHDTPVERVGGLRVMFAIGSLSVAFWLLTGIFGANLGELDALTPPQDYPGRGNTSPLASVVGVGGGGGGGTNSSGHAEEAWIVDDYAKALATAKQTGKSIFVDFTGYTCTNCRWMEKNMFPRGDVSGLLSKYVLVRLYTDGRDSINKVNRSIQVDRFKTIALPFYAVISPADSVIATFPGMTRKPEQFVAFLERSFEPQVATR